MADQLIFGLGETNPPPPTCEKGYHWDEINQICVQDTAPPPTDNNYLWLLLLGLVAAGGVGVYAAKKKE
jgi:LPXTG-motif cell wall-anchored protein